jgi:ferritin-like metal-binding protein YciE
LHDAFLDELRDAYDAEKQLLKALPRMAKKATSEDLTAAFEAHLDETRGHVDKLEQVFGALGEKVRGKHCEGIAGIIEEGKSVMEEDFDAETMDACLIAGGQWAERGVWHVGRLGESDGPYRGGELLEEILEEEKAADEKLTALAEGGINQAAADEAHPAEDEEGEDEEPTAKTAAKKKPTSKAKAGSRG